jgi:hypothetical protein
MVMSPTPHPSSLYFFFFGVSFKATSSSSENIPMGIYAGCIATQNCSLLKTAVLVKQ